MLIASFTDQGRQLHIVDKIHKDNTLSLISEDGELNRWNPKEDKEASFSIFERKDMEIAEGDKVRAVADMGNVNIRQGDQLSVTKIGRIMTQFSNQDGNKIKIGHDQLDGSLFAYNYAKSMGQADQRSQTMVNLKGYAASKESMEDLIRVTDKKLEIFTEDAPKIERRMTLSKIRPSTIHTVMGANSNIEKYVSNDTHKQVKQDVETAIQALSTSQDKEHNKDLVSKSVEFAISKISEKQAAFRHQDLVKEAIQYSFDEEGKSITKAEIETKLEKMTQKGDTLSASYGDGIRWTTKEAIATESRILDKLSEDKGKLDPLVPEQKVKDYLENNNKLTKGQREAIYAMATTKDRYLGVQGFAGTGKSTMLETGVELIKAAQSVLGNEIDFIGLAPTYSAVNQLKDKGINAQTSQSLIQEMIGDDFNPKKYEKTIFLLDESSMVSNAQMDKYTSLIAQSNARSDFLGDKGQLPSQSAGKPFELAMSRGAIQTVVMKDIVRQDSKEVLEAVKNVIDKNPEATVKSLESQEAFTDYKEEGQRYSKTFKAHNLHKHKKENVVSSYENLSKDNKANQVIADGKLSKMVAYEWLSRTENSRDNTLIIAYSNKDRDEVTSYLRSGLKEEGSLGDKDETMGRLRPLSLERTEMSTMRPYQTGLIFSRKNGNYNEIMDVNKQHSFITIKDMETGKVSDYFPKKAEHKHTDLLVKSNQKLAVGDHIMMRKTNKSAGYITNEEYKVSGIDKAGDITILGENNKTHTLNNKNMGDMHWDYAYVKTADMAQGSTHKNVITMIRSSALLTNIKRAYIDISRASSHVKLFTDNTKKMMLSWINNGLDFSFAHSV